MNDHSDPTHCLVCFDVNAAKHYGSICCSGCKGFFRRTVRFNRKYSCVNNNTCQIKTEYRNCCRACRFEKCIKAGLNPLMVHSDRGQTVIQTKSEQADVQVKKEKLNDAKTQTTKSNADSRLKTVSKRRPFDLDTDYNRWFALATNGAKRLSEPSNLPLGMMKIIPQFDRNSSNNIATYYVLVERLCESYFDSNFHHLMSDDTEYTHSLDLPARLAFNKPRAISARTKLEWNGRFHTQGKYIKRMWCRIVAYYADWCNHLPELHELDELDKCKLITERTVPVIDFMLAYKAVEFNVNGLPLSGGSYFPFDKEEQKMIDPTIVPYFRRLVNWIEEELVAPIRELGLTKTEYVILKNILFFSASTSLSPKGIEIVNQARRFYRNILCKTIQNEFPNFSTDETLERIVAIMDLLPKIEQARVIEDEDFAVMTIFNISDMKGSLTFDVHIKKGVE